MPSESEAQRRFMAADLSRLRRGLKTKSGMTETQLRHFARKSRRRGGSR